MSKSAPLPPWWDHYPPDLADFYLRAHASIGCSGEILFDPSGCRAESAIFASLPAPTHQDWQYYGGAPDPHELFEIAILNQFELLFLDVGRPTHDGWVRSWPDEDGGVDRVDILEAVDHFLIDDYPYQSTRTSGQEGPARPRDHTLDRPNAPYWGRILTRNRRAPGVAEPLDTERQVATEGTIASQGQQLLFRSVIARSSDQKLTTLTDRSGCSPCTSTTFSKY